MEIDVTDAVDAFKEIIKCSWPHISKLSDRDKTTSFRQDWMQANWEMIVEASLDIGLNIALEVYGDGADCNIKSSRVWKPNVVPSAAVCVRYVGNEELLNALDGNTVSGRLEVNYFATMKDGWPIMDNPFDHVVLNTPGPVVIPARDLRYYIIA